MLLALEARLLRERSFGGRTASYDWSTKWDILVIKHVAAHLQQLFGGRKSLPWK